MQIDIAPTELTRFHSEPRRALSFHSRGNETEELKRRSESRGSTLEQTRAMESKGTLESMIIQAIAGLDGSLRLGRDLGVAVLSAKEQANYTLLPEEERVLSPRACVKKRVEFALGRTAAHLALKQVGFDNPPPVLRGKRGEPLFAGGVVGSITHCDPWSVAVVAKRHVVGVDLESLERMRRVDISDLICRDAELEWVRGGNCQERLAMIFSAKEAVYKAFDAVWQRYVDFKEVELTWLPEKHLFRGAFLTPFSADCAPTQLWEVESRRRGDLVFSCMIREPN